MFKILNNQFVYKRYVFPLLNGYYYNAGSFSDGMKYINEDKSITVSLSFYKPIKNDIKFYLEENLKRKNTDGRLIVLKPIIETKLNSLKGIYAIFEYNHTQTYTSYFNHICNPDDVYLNIEINADKYRHNIYNVLKSREILTFMYQINMPH